MALDRWLLLALAIFCVSGCGSAAGPAAEPGVLTVEIRDVARDPMPEPDAFEVIMYETERVEEVTAVGDLGDPGTTPLGGSCAQLEDDFPDLIGCEEHRRVFDRNINVPIPLGGLDDKGRFVLDIPDRPITLVITAVDPDDEYCDFTGSEQIPAGTTQFTFEIDYGCS